MINAQSIDEALFIKTLEGAAYAIILPSLMTALADSSGSKGGAVIYYVTASVAGSLTGRALSGALIASGFHSELWLLLSILLSICVLSVLVFVKPLAGPLMSITCKKSAWLSIKRRDVLLSYFLIFTGVMCFVSVLNYLPFHMRQTQPDISETSIAWLYSGYAFGIFTSVYTSRLRAFFNRDATLFIFALAGMAGSIAIMANAGYWISLGAVAMLCGSVFVLHSGLSAYLNSELPESRNLVNGIYLTVYYLGGALSSTLPGIVFMSFGWVWLLILLLLALTCALVITYFLF